MIPYMIFTFFTLIAVQKEVVVPLLKKHRCENRQAYKVYKETYTLIQVEKRADGSYCNGGNFETNR